MLKARPNAGHIHCATCRVNKLCLPRDLHGDEVEQLNLIIDKIKFAQKGEHIFHADDAMTNLYAVYSGFCKDYCLDENGNERIDNFYLPGDFIGLESMPHRKHFFSLVALEDTMLCLIPIDALFALMKQHENILKRIMHLTSHKMQNDRQIRITTNANQRIADFILNIFLRLQERDPQMEEISLPMSQLDISNFLGMAHETVNRTLRKLQDEKIITLKNKKIEVVDVERLKEIGTSIPIFGQS